MYSLASLLSGISPLPHVSSFVSAYSFGKTNTNTGTDRELTINEVMLRGGSLVGLYVTQIHKAEGMGA